MRQGWWLFAIAVAGCQPPSVPDQNAATLQALTPAKRCEAGLPYFGHYQYGRDDTGLQYAAADGRIAMANDGGWCAIRHVFFRRERQETPELFIIQNPAHGAVTVGSVAGELRIAYRPAPGFTGQDAFELRTGGNDRLPIPVWVTVLP